ncbi:MAG: hypothetical protein IIB77_11825 [Proteobacteria bacterium]|nr:hypothetical protein [Pseudomonadota bacterium]
MTMVDVTHWTSDTPIEAGWYWYKDATRGTSMLRIDDHGRVDSHGDFDRNLAKDLVGDWWIPRIKVFV